MRYIDPTGHGSEDWDPNWATAFKQTHKDAEPTETDWNDYQISKRFAGTGPKGSWTEDDWTSFYRVKRLLQGKEDLAEDRRFFDVEREIGRKRLDRGVESYSLAQWIDGTILARSISGLTTGEEGPDGTRIIIGDHQMIPANAGGITLGNVILLRASRYNRQTLIHEYVHVLQYRKLGFSYGFAYAGPTQGFSNWDTGRFEQQAMQIENIYSANPWLPSPWDLFG